MLAFQNDVAVRRRAIKTYLCSDWSSGLGSGIAAQYRKDVCWRGIRASPAMFQGHLTSNA